MSLALRLVLMVGAIITFILIAQQVRKHRIQVEDAIFWIILSLVLLILAFFPGIAYFFANLFGFQAASNFVFCALIAILIVREFSSSAEISRLKHKVNQLVEEIALAVKDKEERESGDL